MGSADVQPLTLYELLLFSAAIYGCLHVERNYSLSLLSHLNLTLTLEFILLHPMAACMWNGFSLSLLSHLYLTLTLLQGEDLSMANARVLGEVPQCGVPAQVL